MNRITRNFAQGSAEWLSDRAKFFNASDCAAMLGISPHETRDELIHRLATGESKPVDQFTRKLFADGHRFEALAREYVEGQLGIDLFPASFSLGNLRASLDGINIEETVIWEHKMWNADLATVCVHGFDDGLLPTARSAELPTYIAAQLEHQQIVVGVDKTLLTASEWTESNELLNIGNAIYRCNPSFREHIIAGWVQLEKDIAAYRVPEPAPLLVAERLDRLPALIAETTGVVVASNLAEFKRGAMEIIDGIRTDLSTDQDFTDAAAAIKWCESSEKKIKTAEENALSGDVRKLIDTLRDLREAVRAKRLNLDKQVTHRKDVIKRALVDSALASAREHVMTLEHARSAMKIRELQDPLDDCIRGKSSIAIMQSALNAKVAELKIQANALNDRMSRNAELIDAQAEHAALFADRETLLARESDFVALTVKARIDAHKAKIASDVEALALKQREEEAQKASPPALAEPKPELEPQPVPVVQIAAPVVEPAKPEESKPAATLTLGQINARLVCVSVSGAQLRALGFDGEQVRNARMYSEQDLREIRAAIISNLSEGL